MFVPFVRAQGVSLEELQRKIDQTRREQAPRDKSSTRKKRAEAAAPASAPAAAPAVRSAGPPSTLVVTSDTACQLRVDGRIEGHVKPDEPLTVALMPGKSLIECTSAAVSTVKYGSVFEIKAGVKDVLQISLAKTEDNERLRLEQEAKTTLKDTRAGLIWANSDNGSDINWNDARSYCVSKGGGWDLPTVAELQSLFDANLPPVTGCGPTQLCRVRAGFRLTSSYLWSQEPNGTSEARLFSLSTGIVSTFSVRDLQRNRALCVRRS